MSWYNEEPVNEEIVMCTVTNFDPNTGFTVTLNEYNDKIGLLPLKELHKKRIRKNIASFLKLNKEYPLMVIDADSITLSKKSLRDSDVNDMQVYYHLTHQLFKLTKRLYYFKKSIPEQEWYQTFQNIMTEYMVDNYKTDDLVNHPYNIISSHTRLHANSLEIPERQLAVLYDNHVKLFGLQVVTNNKIVEIYSYRIDGNEYIKNQLLDLTKDYATIYTPTELYNDKSLVNLSIIPVAVPRFKIVIQSYLRETADTMMSDLLKSINESGFDYVKVL
jgi:translation initiation factor 2 alpha subunit (eIF-2alpha)